MRRASSPTSGGARLKSLGDNRVSSSVAALYERRSSSYPMRRSGKQCLPSTAATAGGCHAHFEGGALRFGFA